MNVKLPNSKRNNHRLLIVSACPVKFSKNSAVYPVKPVRFLFNWGGFNQGLPTCPMKSLLPLFHRGGENEYDKK